MTSSQLIDPDFLQNLTIALAKVDHFTKRRHGKKPARIVIRVPFDPKKPYYPCGCNPDKGQSWDWAVTVEGDLIHCGCKNPQWKLPEQFKGLFQSLLRKQQRPVILAAQTHNPKPRRRAVYGASFLDVRSHAWEH